MNYTLLMACLLGVAMADMYMMNPRGSNDRLNENNTNRNNANRLFDSQNNAKGGFCWGRPLEYYENSRLSLEWTNQHACGSDDTNCQIVIQYMCGTEVRDGLTTNTIPDDEATYNTEANIANQANQGGNTDIEDKDDANQSTGVRVNDDFDLLEELLGTDTTYLYGMHEDFAFYQGCKDRERNKGLFTADENVTNNQGATATRQNPGGNNNNPHGFECPEERDYYPYWHPTPWVDVAVLTTDTSRCDYYKSESQNGKNKGICTPWTAGNNEAACTAEGGVWTEAGKFGVGAPDCVEAPRSRDNHLGNGAGENGNANNMYNWTLPSVSNFGPNADACTVRMRYNISTNDYDGWNTYVMPQELSPVADDPRVQVTTPEGDLKPLELAIDTNQFGRTFQDRSHTFMVKGRPDGVGPAKIYNLNVRGKRGNIVQTYPAVEYDFTPKELEVRKGDYIHVMWTGCNTNPAGNDGEGQNQTDRSNIVEVQSANQNLPKQDGSLFGQTLAAELAHIGQGWNTQQCDEDEENQQDNNNCSKLNGAHSYQNHGLVKLESTGTFWYMSTRNNNYTNRAQKASINVSPFLPTWAIVVIVLGGALFLAAVGVAGAILYGKTHPNSAVNKLTDL